MINNLKFGRLPHGRAQARHIPGRAGPNFAGPVRSAAANLTAWNGGRRIREISPPAGRQISRRRRAKLSQSELAAWGDPLLNRDPLVREFWSG